MKAAFLDLEGPLSPQDNAYEVAALLSRGRELFERISSYDDKLAMRGTPGYEAGDTLCLIAPFLVAGDVKQSDIEKISERAGIVRGAPELISHLRETGWRVYIISTSYSTHAHRIGSKVGVEEENVRCTPLDLEELREGLDDDFFDLVESRTDELLDGDESVLDHFFFTELPETSYGDPFDRVKVVGGARKADALRDIAQSEGVEISNSLVVGDSITDREMLRLARERGGLSVVFNGNKYALSMGEYGVASTDLRLVRVFSDLEDPRGVAEGWQGRRDEIAADPRDEAGLIPHGLSSVLDDLDPFPHVHHLGDGYEQFMETHLRFRRLLRGEAAKLG
ncbi:MAG: hypothetical protein MAG715_00764 [Methanonatronarchaeales archaeon]|nr:hypothetical protein [Methanonatronarchaeales archaeon]